LVNRAVQTSLANVYARCPEEVAYSIPATGWRNPPTTGACGAVASTTVHIAPLSEADIDAYVGTGEPLHVAGSFTIDGLGGPFIAGIEGDPSNVVGCSLPLLRTLSEQLGVPWPTLWMSTLRT
jgi:septum formation protein